MAPGTASVVGADSYPRPVGRGVPDPEVARLAGLLSRRFDELVDRLTDRIAAEVDLYRSDAVVPRAELRRSVRDNFEFMLGQMSTSDAPDLSAPRLTGRLRAQEGAPLPEVLRAYRLGFAFLWEELLGEARPLAARPRWARWPTPPRRSGRAPTSTPSRSPRRTGRRSPGAC